MSPLLKWKMEPPKVCAKALTRTAVRVGLLQAERMRTRTRVLTLGFSKWAQLSTAQIPFVHTLTTNTLSALVVSISQNYLKFDMAQEITTKEPKNFLQDIMKVWYEGYWKGCISFYWKLGLIHFILEIDEQNIFKWLELGFLFFHLHAS